MDQQTIEFFIGLIDILSNSNNTSNEIITDILESMNILDVGYGSYDAHQDLWDTNRLLAKSVIECINTKDERENIVLFNIKKDQIDEKYFWKKLTIDSYKRRDYDNFWIHKWISLLLVNRVAKIAPLRSNMIVVESESNNETDLQSLSKPALTRLFKYSSIAIKDYNIIPELKLCHIDLSGHLTDLSHAYFSCIDFSNAIFVETVMCHADFSNTILVNADLTGASLAYAILAKSHLTRAVTSVTGRPDQWY